MVTDFKETLEIKKNSKCFLSYSWCWTKQDLVDLSVIDKASGNEESLEEVEDRINTFLFSADKCEAAIRYLLDNGKVCLIEEY